MTTDIVATNNELVEFSDEMIAKASEMLGCKLDKASAYKALCIQRDTGLSIVRGEISIVQYNGKPVVQINKQGYISYANSNPQYDNFEWDYIDENGPLDKVKCWVKVYRKDRTRPTYECIRMGEFNKGTANWKTMPLHMLKVRCLSLALRDAFPLLNGTLTDDEVADMRAEGYKIEPMESDIDVTPVESKQQAPTTEECNDFDLSKPFYTKQNIETIMENAKSKGFELTAEELFCSKRSDGFYDRKSIDTVFNRKKEEAALAQES